jgi:uncharacterized protein HemY
VVRFVTENFVPVRVHVREQADEFKRLGERFGAQWTPTILEVDDEGKERHRVEGFLTADEFIPQLMLGLGHDAFERGDWNEAQRRFREALDRFPDSDAAPEALYWEGVARYKDSHDNADLIQTARALAERFAGTIWSKKASIWAPARA